MQQSLQQQLMIMQQSLQNIEQQLMPQPQGRVDALQQTGNTLLSSKQGRQRLGSKKLIF